MLLVYKYSTNIDCKVALLITTEWCGFLTGAKQGNKHGLLISLVSTELGTAVEPHSGFTTVTRSSTHNNCDSDHMCTQNHDFSWQLYVKFTLLPQLRSKV